MPAADVAELLLSAIASDTINFDSSKGRCTTTDLWAAEQVCQSHALSCAANLIPKARYFVQPCLGRVFQLRPHVAESTDVLFQRVQEAKFDVAGLTAMELLLKVRFKFYSHCSDYIGVIRPCACRVRDAAPRFFVMPCRTRKSVRSGTPNLALAARPSRSSPSLTG